MFVLAKLLFDNPRIHNPFLLTALVTVGWVTYIVVSVGINYTVQKQ